MLFSSCQTVTDPRVDTFPRLDVVSPFHHRRQSSRCCCQQITAGGLLFEDDRPVQCCSVTGVSHGNDDDLLIKFIT